MKFLSYNKLFIPLLIIFIVTSCSGPRSFGFGTIQKRKHLKGYDITIHNKKYKRAPKKNIELNSSVKGLKNKPLLNETSAPIINSKTTLLTLVADSILLKDKVPTYSTQDSSIKTNGNYSDLNLAIKDKKDREIIRPDPLEKLPFISKLAVYLLLAIILVWAATILFIVITNPVSLSLVLPFFGSIGLFIGGLILSIFGYKKAQSFPEQYAVLKAKLVRSLFLTPIVFLAVLGLSMVLFALVLINI